MGMMHAALNHVLEKRRMLVKLSGVVSLLALSENKRSVNRSCRRLPRNTGWWDQIWQTYSDTRFKKTFRVSRCTFNYILENIKGEITHDIINEQPVSAECRLGICLYRLGRGDYYYTISEMSGLGLSTVCEIVSEVSRAIINKLWSTSVTKFMPTTEEEFKSKILDMEEMWQFPYCWAALDGCHIPIKCPPGGKNSCKEYHNYKNFYSIVLMAFVDSHYRFIWASCGFPGNSHDSVIFASTSIYHDIEEENLIPEIGKEIDGITIPPLLVGDSAFPFHSWLMKPYTNAVLTPKQRNFNYRLSRARMVTEGAYGQLKGRWRVLLRKCESTPEEVKIATLACIVLHNICLERGDTIPTKLDLTIDPLTNQKRNRNTIRALLNMRNCKPVKDSSRSANQIRKALTNKLWSEKLNYEQYDN